MMKVRYLRWYCLNRRSLRRTQKEMLMQKMQLPYEQSRLSYSPPVWNPFSLNIENGISFDTVIPGWFFLKPQK